MVNLRKALLISVMAAYLDVPGQSIGQEAVPAKQEIVQQEVIPKQISSSYFQREESQIKPKSNSMQLVTMGVSLGFLGASVYNFQRHNQRNGMWFAVPGLTFFPQVYDYVTNLLK